MQPGDMAEHRWQDLDARPVAEVDHAESTVRLQIGGHVTTPIPMGNYTYFRILESVG